MSEGNAANYPDNGVTMRKPVSFRTKRAAAAFIEEHDLYIRISCEIETGEGGFYLTPERTPSGRWTVTRL